MNPSENHRIIGWLRLEEISGGHWVQPANLLKQGHLELVAQDHVQVTFGYCQGWRLHNLSGQPVPVFSQKCKVLVAGSEKSCLEMSGAHQDSSTICVMGAFKMMDEVQCVRLNVYHVGTYS